MGVTRVGAFDIDAETAAKLLKLPKNVNGRSNAEVIFPWINALDVTGRNRNRFIIDFGELSQQEAAKFEGPFEYVKKHVYPERKDNNRGRRSEFWWQHGETVPGMKKAVSRLARFIVTPLISKHRVFQWVRRGVVPENLLNVLAFDTDLAFGVLTSKIHEAWSLHQGTALEDRPRYTPSSTFFTFPFPYPPGTEPTEAESPIVRAVADAARELVRLRDAWLNPPNASDDDLKSRTLTKLYNARPEWLANAHRSVDEAVFAAYGWPANLTDQEILARLLALNHERAALAPTPTSQA